MKNAGALISTIESDSSIAYSYYGYFVSASTPHLMVLYPQLICFFTHNPENVSLKFEFQIKLATSIKYASSLTSKPGHLDKIVACTRDSEIFLLSFENKVCKYQRICDFINPPAIVYPLSPIFLRLTDYFVISYAYGLLTIVDFTDPINAFTISTSFIFPGLSATYKNTLIQYVDDEDNSAIIYVDVSKVMADKSERKNEVIDLYTKSIPFSGDVRAIFADENSLFLLINHAIQEVDYEGNIVRKFAFPTADDDLLFYQKVSDGKYLICSSELELYLLESGSLKKLSDGFLPTGVAILQNDQLFIGCKSSSPKILLKNGELIDMGHNQSIFDFCITDIPYNDGKQLVASGEEVCSSITIYRDVIQTEIVEDYPGVEADRLFYINGSLIASDENSTSVITNPQNIPLIEKGEKSLFIGTYKDQIIQICETKVIIGGFKRDIKIDSFSFRDGILAYTELGSNSVKVADMSFATLMSFDSIEEVASLCLHPIYLFVSLWTSNSILIFRLSDSVMVEKIERNTLATTMSLMGERLLCASGTGFLSVLEQSSGHWSQTFYDKVSERIDSIIPTDNAYYLIGYPNLKISNGKVDAMDASFHSPVFLESSFYAADSIGVHSYKVVKKLFSRFITQTFNEEISAILPSQNQEILLLITFPTQRLVRCSLPYLYWLDNIDLLPNIQYHSFSSAFLNGKEIIFALGNSEEREQFFETKGQISVVYVENDGSFVHQNDIELPYSTSSSVVKDDQLFVACGSQIFRYSIAFEDEKVKLEKVSETLGRIFGIGLAQFDKDILYFDIFHSMSVYSIESSKMKEVNHNSKTALCGCQIGEEYLVGHSDGTLSALRKTGSGNLEEIGSFAFESPLTVIKNFEQRVAVSTADGGLYLIDLIDENEYQILQKLEDEIKKALDNEGFSLTKEAITNFFIDGSLIERFMSLDDMERKKIIDKNAGILERMEEGLRILRQKYSNSIRL